MSGDKFREREETSESREWHRVGYAIWALVAGKG
jgi:hypothetical protein